MKDLLEYLAKSLVDNPDEVHVEATETDTTVVLELSVAKDDVGKVIGKQGRIARAVRTTASCPSTSWRIMSSALGTPSASGIDDSFAKSL